MRNTLQERNAKTNKNKYKKSRTKERQIAQNVCIARSVGRAEMEKHSKAIKHKIRSEQNYGTKRYGALLHSKTIIK